MKAPYTVAMVTMIEAKNEAEDELAGELQRVSNDSGAA